MALHMQTKFEKYWDTMHDLMGVESILDPRYKMKQIEFLCHIIYPNNVAQEIKKYKDLLYDLVKEYQSKSQQTSSSNENEAKIVTVQYEEVDNNEEEDLGGYGRHLLDGDGDRDFPKSLNQGLGRERGRGWRAGTGMILPYPVPNQPVAIPNL
ncbi:unnamed protein product [Prunus armeniaca]